MLDRVLDEREVVAFEVLNIERVVWLGGKECYEAAIL